MRTKYRSDDIVNLVVKMRLKDMCSTRSILTYLQEELGYGLTMSYNFLNKADDFIKEIHHKCGKDTVEKAIEQMNTLLEMAVKKGDIRSAIAIRKELNEMGGYKVQKIELSGEVATQVRIIYPDGKKEG